MLFTLKEIEKWLQVTVFEMSIACASALIFSILLALKLENVFDATWWTIFTPLYACDALIAYFDLIVFIHLYKANERNVAVKRIMINTSINLLLIIYKVLLCQQLEGVKHMRYSTVHSPLFVLLCVLLVRSCIVSANS